MDQSEFNKVLDLDGLHICERCKELLRVWAEGDPRTSENFKAWISFTEHRENCTRCTLDFPSETRTAA